MLPLGPTDDLDTLLDAWRSQPHRLLADRIDLLPAAPPPELKTGKARLEWAHTAISSGQTEALPAVLAIAHEQSSSKALVPLLDALVDTWPDDPRPTTVFARWLDKPRWTGRSGQKVWVRVFRWLMKTADCRVLDLTTLESTERFPSSSAEWIAHKLQKLGQRTFPDALLHPDDAAHFRQLLDAHREHLARQVAAREQVEALFQQVYADPTDLGLRHVLADALLDLGDPRGEFLQLQLSGSTDRAVQRRLRALAKEHGASWAGPLDAVFLKTARVWRHGFLTEGRLRIRNVQDAKLAALTPSCVLIEHLDVGNPQMMYTPCEELLLGPRWTRLHTVSGIAQQRQLEWVHAMDAPHLREVHFLTPRYGSMGWPPPPESARPRSLERLVVTGGWAGDLHLAAQWFHASEVVFQTTTYGFFREQRVLRHRPLDFFRALHDVAERASFKVLHEGDVVAELSGTSSSMVLSLYAIAQPDAHREALLAALPGLKVLPLSIGTIDAPWLPAVRSALPHLTDPA